MRYTNNDPTYRTAVTRKLVVRGGLLLAGVLLISGLGGWTRRVRASEETVPPPGAAVADQMRALIRRAEKSDGELAVMRVQNDRLRALFNYSTRYQIPADLAADIYDIALSEGIDPAVAFRLVKVESDFKEKARSRADALGYTQIRLGTARFFIPGIQDEQLFQRDVNLRLGFRFLKTLMDQYRGDANLALLGYNRGPARVQAILDQGGDPANGYPEQVLRGTSKSRLGTN